MTVTWSAETTDSEPQVEIRVARTRAEFDSIVRIREQVFRREQGIVGSELTDREEYTSAHVYAAVNEIAVSAGRLAPPTASRPDAQIAWVATLPEWRERGIGARVMAELLAIADRQRYARVTISAQTHALSFYQRLGFRAYGERFVVKGIEHQYMERRRPVD